MISPLTIITLSSLCLAALGEVIPIYRNTPVNQFHAVKLDQNRWRAQGAAPLGAKAVDPVINTIFSYVLMAKVGTPSQTATVVVDTGSTSLWIASKECPASTCGKPKESFDTTKSKTFKKIPGVFQVQYGSGAVSGYWGKDVISITPKLSFTGVIGIANKASGILNPTTDGIMGLRPPQPKADGEVPTVVEELYNAKLTSRRVLSVYFQPMTKGKQTSTNGQLTIGSVDTSNVQGPITYFPITKSMPAAHYWGFDHKGIMIGKKNLSPKGSGILDTGTTLILLDTKLGQAFFKSIPGSSLDSQTGLYTYPCAGLKNYPDFSISIGGRKFTLSAEEYTAPAFLMEEIGMPKGSKTCSSWISEGNTGFDIILGQKFLEYYVSIFDSDKRTMGLGLAIQRSARNAHTNSA